MNAGQPITLGEILADTLRVVGNAARLRLDARVQYLCAVELSRQLALMLRVGEVDVLDVLCAVPDNLLPLLKSPEGWAALSAIAAYDLGAESPALSVTIH